MEKKLKTTLNGPVQETLCSELVSFIDKVKIVDVRTVDEFSGELGHIPHSELATLGDPLEEFLSSYKDKENEVVFVCRSGIRSYTAAELALQHGFKNPINLVGGMLDWNEAGYPTEEQ